MNHFTMGILIAGCVLFATKSHAQSIINFEDVSIPSGSVSLSASFPSPSSDSIYSFTSGNAIFKGLKASWGGYNYFDCSRSTDSSTAGWTNDKSAITGSGNENSEQYTIVYLPSNWPSAPEETLPYGFRLNDVAKNSRIVSAHFSNATYTYKWIEDNLSSVSFMHLIIKGYNDSVFNGDSIIVQLYNKSSTDTILPRTWQYVNLLTLGKVDSVTFQLVADNDYTPFYFAIDDILTMDNACNNFAFLDKVAAEDNTVTVSITDSSKHSLVVEQYEIAIDKSPTLAPAGSSIFTSDTSYTFSDLEFETDYVVHFRAMCVDSIFGDWDTLHITTEKNTSIAENSQDKLFTIYPNPANDWIYISGIDQSPNFNYVIFNTLGVQVKKGVIQDKVDISQLQPGMYFIQINSHSKSAQQVEKFIKN